MATTIRISKRTFNALFLGVLVFFGWCFLRGMGDSRRFADHGKDDAEKSQGHDEVGATVRVTLRRERICRRRYPVRRHKRTLPS